jgi:hypothetical protein
MLNLDKPTNHEFYIINALVFLFTLVKIGFYIHFHSDNPNFSLIINTRIVASVLKIIITFIFTLSRTQSVKIVLKFTLG